MSDEYSVDPYDRVAFQVSGFLHSQERTLTVPDKIETVQFTVQTYRSPDGGETILLVRVDRNGATRIAIPPSVAAALARQREALAARARSLAGKQHAPRLREMAAQRKAAGIAPAFLKNRGKRLARRRARKS